MAGKHEEFTDSDAVYKALLESTQAIPWKIDWATMQFSYIGPQIERVLGWSQSSWVTINDWATRMHAEDRDHAVNFCVAQSKAGVDHEVDYRALTKDNDYVWIRDVVHVVRDENGQVQSLVGFMFDISARKKAEEQVLKLQKELEALSFTDGLTGLANRRLFDSRLEDEWASARRSNKPLSLIMLDIDFFKQYNDHYGHIQGDACLKSVAQALARAALRPRDITARFGGEEFALLLPETDESAALKIAQRCHGLIAESKIPHEKSAINAFVTVSIGVGTVTEFGAMASKEFVATVDKLLYSAKQNGRNRIESQRL